MHVDLRVGNVLSWGGLWAFKLLVWEVDALPLVWEDTKTAWVAPASMILPSGAELPKSLTDHGNRETCWVQPVAFWMVGGCTPFPPHSTGMSSTYLAPLVQEWWCKERQLPVGKVANRSITGGPHEENTGWINHPFCQKGLAHMRESICLDVAWTWKVNWHEPDVLPVAKLEMNHQAGQSEWFGTVFLDDVRHNHCVVAHQAHYPRLALRQGHGYTQEHCLHL